MSGVEKLRTYRFHGLDIQVRCSETMAAFLGNRFRGLPGEGDLRGTIALDFRSLADPSQHSVEKPLGQGRDFYEFPVGEACYFQTRDEIYLRFRDGVRVLGKPSEGCASFSIVESDPANLFMASHLMLTILLVEFLKRRGCYGTHAAAFSKNGKAILIPGTSGAGKSTLSIALLRSGFDYLSDDMVYLRWHSGELKVLSFPEDVDVSDHTISFFPELDFLRSVPKSVAWAKASVRADEVYGSVSVREARPGAIVIPKISGKAKSTIRPIDADDALREIVSNVLLTEARSCQSHLDILTQLVRQTPCYRLETGRDFDCIPQLFCELLHESREEVHG
jgi:hypothetical protein